MASPEQIGIRREEVINRLESLINNLATELNLESNFTLAIQERDATLRPLRQLEALAEKLEQIVDAVASRHSEMQATVAELDAQVGERALQIEELNNRLEAALKPKGK